MRRMRSLTASCVAIPTALLRLTCRTSLTFDRMFEAPLSEDLTGKLGHYETTMQRQLSQTIKA
jgi:hypothetical protein